MKFPTLEEALKWSLDNPNSHLLADVGCRPYQIWWDAKRKHFRVRDEKYSPASEGSLDDFTDLTNFRTPDEDEKVRGEIPESVVQEMKDAFTADGYGVGGGAVLAMLKVYHAKMHGKEEA